MITSSESNNCRVQKPVFRILLVEDEPWFLKELVALLRDFCDDYYQLKFDVASDVETGLGLLKRAVDDHRPYDAVLLDYKLPASPRDPIPQKSIQLSLYCVAQSTTSNPPGRWIRQVTAYSDDPELRRFWNEHSGAKGFSSPVYSKDGVDLLRMARDMFFPEIKEPLDSQWLREELGAVELPIGRRKSNTPEGFSIYQFIDRLSTVWPALDEETRSKAMELFEIGPNDPNSPTLNRIGFRTFSCWNRKDPILTKSPA